jgi:hypothetical protein
MMPLDASLVNFEVGERGEIFAVRPDGYIDLRTRIDDPSRLRDYMAALYGTAA